MGEIVGYIRVSSASQDYAYQRHAIDAAARARGDRVDRWYADVGSGGTLDRAELRRLRSALEVRGVRRVWVWRLDRLTRGGIAETIACVDHVRRCGAELVSVAERWLDSGPAADLVLAALAWCAQQERAKIRENQEAARERLAREGRGWGRPRAPEHLIDAARALSSRGLSVRQIAREMKKSKSWVQSAIAKTDP